MLHAEARHTSKDGAASAAAEEADSRLRREAEVAGERVLPAARSGAAVRGAAEA